MPHGELRLLGAPVWEAAGQSHPLAAERLTQMLALLAVAGSAWVPRDRIVALLWPELATAPARRNLRKLLFRARQVPGLPAIEGEGDALRWRVASDLQRFEAARAAGHWLEIAELPPGRLLDGIEHAASAPFAEWLHFERSRVDAAWRAAFVAALAAAGDDAAARERLARRWRAADAYDEEALIELHRALCARGRGDEAERERVRYVESLRAELGLPASARVLALANAAAPSAVAPPVDHGLVGRRSELRQLQQTLAHGGCRLLTVVGAGGVGKSTLLRAARLTAVARGESWLAVSLEDLGGTEALPARIALAAGVDLRGQVDAWAELAHALRSRALTLVLDNAEHLPDLREHCRRLLEGCPGLRLLVGSRARLAIDGEWLLPLDGLPVPDADDSDPASLAAFDAVRLFVRRAQAAAPGLAVAQALPEIAALARDVEGLPLAIELAAAQARLWPVAEIRAALARSIDLLARGDGASRRDSIRASLAHSWRLLAPAQARALAAMAVFPGAFSAAAALAVAAATPAVLASLVDASMLRADGHGRFSLHPLLRQDAGERLGSDARAAAARLHAEFHARRLAESAQAKAAAHADVLGEVEIEFENLRAAWQQACAMPAPALLQPMTRPLLRYFEARARWREGLSWFGAAVAALEAAPARTAPRQRRPVLAGLYGALATLAYRAGDLAEAEMQGRHALALWRRLGDDDGLAMALNVLGLIAWQRGRHRVALARFERAQQAADRHGDPGGAARAAASVALAEKALGRYPRAQVQYERALALRRQLGDVLGLAATLNNLGNLLRAQHRWAEARPYFEEAVQVCDSHRLVSSRLFPLVNLGLTALELGDIDAAERWLTEADAQLEEHGERYLIGAVAAARSRTALQRGDLVRCALQISRALATGSRLADLPLQLNALACAALWLGRRGEGARAAALLHFVAGHRGAEAATRLEARELALAAVASSAAQQTARRAARQLQLEDAVRELQRETAGFASSASEQR